MVTFESWAAIHAAWFERVYMMVESDAQFVWRKIFIEDQLVGLGPVPNAFELWTGPNCRVVGIVNEKRMLGAGCYCNVDASNLSAELKILWEPRACPNRAEIRETLLGLLDGGFRSGLERIYGYVPLIGRGGKSGQAFRVWQKVLGRITKEKLVRCVGVERHAIRTKKRFLGRMQFEAIKNGG